MKGGHWRNIFFLFRVLNWTDEYNHSHACTVDSNVHKAD
jgi:hypothetical protein